MVKQYMAYKLNITIKLHFYNPRVRITNPVIQGKRVDEQQDS